MAAAVGDTDLAKMSDLLSLAADAQPGEGLPDAVLAALAGLVRCDVLSFVDMDVATATEHLDQEYDGTGVTTVRDVHDPEHPFWSYYWTTEDCSYPSRTGDDRSVTKLSDFYSLRQWHATPMYRDMFIDYGVDHELMCCLPTVGTRTRRLLFARGPGPDFDERDRTVLTLLRPHLVELHTRRTAAERSETRALTSRQMELLRLVAAGKSTQQIADALFLSPRTVRKHLENIFERLGVTNRTAAVVRGLAEG